MSRRGLCPFLRRTLVISQKGEGRKGRQTRMALRQESYLNSRRLDDGYSQHVDYAGCEWNPSNDRLPSFASNTMPSTYLTVMGQFLGSLMGDGLLLCFLFTGAKVVVVAAAVAVVVVGLSLSRSLSL